jgi:hypothetical protein
LVLSQSHVSEPSDVGYVSCVGSAVYIIIIIIIIAGSASSEGGQKLCVMNFVRPDLSIFSFISL